MKNLFGKIIGLTRLINIQDKPDDSYYIHKFFAGKPTLMNPFGGVATEWYLHPNVKKMSDDILEIARVKCQGFLGIDEISFYKIIERILKENALNTELFDIDRIAFRRVQTLFDARLNSVDAKIFAERIWKIIEAETLASNMDWLLLYPLQKLELENSKSLSIDGITLLSPNDECTWSSFYEKYSNTRGWDIKSGKYRGRPNDISLIGNTNFTWIIVEENGTEIGVRRSASSRIRTFLSVLFSMLENHHQLFIHSSGEGVGYAFQFPSDCNSVGYGSSCLHIGVMYPAFSDPIIVSEQIFNKVYNWYSLCKTFGEESLQKCVVASHYINYGINADEDLDRFIHLFIALDALFGKRGEVERGIKFGLKETFDGDSNWIKRASKLFDLRNELLHGGSSSISDWNELETYEKTFQTNPLDDVLEASLRAFANFFTLPVYERQKLCWSQRFIKWIKDFPIR